MKQHLVGLGIIFLMVGVTSGCDSGQYGELAPTEPKTESTLMTAAEVQNLEEPSMEDGALLANEEATGAGENAEGIHHYQQGRWHVAQEHFNNALATNANLPEAHYNLALALDKLGDHGAAMNHFTLALKLAPEDPRIKDSGILKSHVRG